MSEENLLDQAIKKKKRRILIVLLFILLMGILATFPLTKLTTPSPTAVVQVTITATPLPLTPTPTPEALVSRLSANLYQVSGVIIIFLAAAIALVFNILRRR